MTFSWIPFYEQLADRLGSWRATQSGLLELLATLDDQGLPVISLDDKSGGRSVRRSAIDPFTFFATFNRNVRDDNRQSILTAVRDTCGVEVEVPVDFQGIPVVDNMQSWFFPYADERGDGDVDALWDLFAQAVHTGFAGIDAATFDRCLRIKNVGRAKLTMGLFWVRPRSFLPLDTRTKRHLLAHGIKVPNTFDWASYARIVDAVKDKIGSDFPAISLAAFTGEDSQPGARRYWAGGHQFGDASQLQQFKDTRRWWIGWPKTATTKGARGAWARIERVREGDLFAIKGYGGRNQLRVHLVGRVTSVDADAGRVALEPLQRTLFRGKAPGQPGDGTWFETLVEVTSPDAVAAIFGPGTSRAPTRAPDLPRNLILYGPPGTGKTYEVLRTIRPHFDLGSAPDVPETPDVAGLTWFEVVALALHELGPTDVPTLQDHPLVRAKYAERGAQTKLGAFVWAQLQGHTVESSTTVNYAKRFGLLVFDRMPDGRWYLPNGLPDELRALLPEIRTAGHDGEPDNQFFVTFHPSFTYEDFVEGLRPESDAEDEATVRYPIRAGIFKQACERAVQLTGFSAGLDGFCRLPRQERAALMEDAPPVAVFIDEINRGNVARILGELITLIEPDKRLGQDNEIIVSLPGSRRLFGVPSNLWLIGTMNTADRSVVALDTALRRRFAFRECPPRPELLEGTQVEGVDLRRLLATINARIERLRDRDHLIGHAFLLPLKARDRQTIDRLRAIFREAILPLLQEYFYDDLGRIGLVLGPKFVVAGEAAGDVFAPGFQHDQRDDLADRRTWRLANIDALDAAAFRSIYG